MDNSLLHVEDIKWSCLSPELKLYRGNLRNIMDTRRDHLIVTSMVWVTLQPCISVRHNILYNPQTPILLFLQ